jgi:2,4-dienoyl-CoA reductase-like NADH-dependent reductase (Old Yellow Enzyme family)
MSKLFQPSAINGMTLANRFVRSATWEGLAAADGGATPELVAVLAALAAGGVGLIVTGHAYVRPDGQAGPRQLGIHADRLVPGLQAITAAVHGAGGRIVAQLAHAGTFAAEDLSGTPPLAVSAFEGLAGTPRREIAREEIPGLVAAYTAAARRAKAAGFDGVQIHSAHGYLLSQFLSPAFNRRTDEYGGPIYNRCRIHRQILAGVREAVGEAYPVLIKMNGRDHVPGGLELEDALETGSVLADAGLDAIELSGGLLTGGKLSPSRTRISSEEKEAYFQEEARAFREEIDIPLILVGGIRSFEVAERLVKKGLADYIAMSRPFIREPGLIARWKAGDRRRAVCRSDNLCFRPGLAGDGVYCVTAAAEKASSPGAPT